MTGLKSAPKYLPSKYFYDAEGDTLFQKIMRMPEYYPTRCEAEIFRKETAAISTAITGASTGWDLVELGAGDATKTIHLLRHLLERKQLFTYVPIDISRNIITHLQHSLPSQLPALSVKGLNGDYFRMLKQAYRLSARRKVILFLGSNIGNFTTEEAGAFVETLHELMVPGDQLLIGFDLKKHPSVILDAYNDQAGITKEFNLNLLRRINRELDADFDPACFDHFPTYDPLSGACKSYLVSLREQKAQIGGEMIPFAKNEPIYMEISQKYALPEIDAMAEANGFTPTHHFFDSKTWFVDVLWQRE